MTLRKITAALMAAIMLASLIPFTAFAGEGIVPRWTDEGNYDIAWYVGNEHDTEYTITTAAQLAGLSALSNATATGVDAAVMFLGKTISLGADIDLGAHEWTPIADSDEVSVFKGTFDGRYHTINNLNISQSANDGCGIFGFTDTTSLIKRVSVNGTVITDISFVGAIVGYNCGAVKYCNLSGTLTGDTAVGGIIGLNATTGTVDSCVVTGELNGNSIVGGIAGANYGEFYNCESHGVLNGDYIIGGLAGLNEGLIINCLSIGGVRTGLDMVGGLIGHNIAGQLVNCITVPLEKPAGSLRTGVLAGVNEPGAELCNCMWRGLPDLVPIGAGYDCADHCTAFDGTLDNILLDYSCYGYTKITEFYNSQIDIFRAEVPRASALHYWRAAKDETENYGYPHLDIPTSIGGTVSFVNNSVVVPNASGSVAAYGDTLSANISSITPVEAQASLAFQWQRSVGSDKQFADIPGATSSSYTLTIDDIGAYIRVYVEGEGNYADGLYSATTGPITLATPVYTAPSSLSSHYGDTLANVEIPTADNGAFFWTQPLTTSVGNIGDNSFSMIFVPDDRGCETVTDIEVTVQVAAQLAQDAPPAPRFGDPTSDSILVEHISGQEYSIDGGTTWRDGGLFSGLEPLTTYEVITRKTFDEEIQEASLESSSFITTTRTPVVTIASNNSFTLGDNSFYTNEQILLGASGAGMNSTDLSEGDTKWLPANVRVLNSSNEQVLVSTLIATKNYNYEFNLFNAGSYTVNVLFIEYIYDGSRWTVTENSDTKSQNIIISAPVVFQSSDEWVMVEQAVEAIEVDNESLAISGFATISANSVELAKELNTFERIANFISKLFIKIFSGFFATNFIYVT